MSKYNEKQKEYTMKYMNENLEEVRFRVRKGVKADYQKAADKSGLSLTRYIMLALEEKISRDQNMALNGIQK
jgi:predicted HicB family RNase H-like nuclease